MDNQRLEIEEREAQKLIQIEKNRRDGSANDLDIYRLINIDDASEEILSEPGGGYTRQLLALFEKFPRDGSLVIYDSEDIWNMADPNSVPLIEFFIKAGVGIDHNKFLEYTFAGDHDDVFELFDLLIENFTDFTQKALMSTCETVLSNMHNPKNKNEIENLKVITTLFKKIDSLDTVFEDSHYYSLFGTFLTLAPQLLLSLDDISDDYIPSPSALEGIRWDSFVGEADFGEQHLITLKALIARGAQFPLEKIIEALEESEMEEFIAELKAMIK